jgi:hypothetical protein
MLSYGTVTVSTGEVANEFQLIEHPVTFATQINQQIMKAASGVQIDN